MSGPVDDLIIPVPGIARSIALTMTVDDPDEEVGATRVVAPDGTLLYTTPLLPADLYTELVRHQPALGSSVLMMPSSIDTPIQAGAYEVDVSSLRTNGSPGTSTPHVVAAVKTDDLATLDLHFYFLDLTDHPCRAAFNDVTLNASLAPTSNVFQTIFLSSVQTLLDTAGVSLNNVTYDDLVGHPDLDALESVDLSSLLSLGEDRSGVNVFFVRSIAPAGMQAIVDGTPGSPRKAGAGPGGVVIGIDTLCYRDWTRMAHITAHAIARHMGLYRNREPDGGLDPISDSDATSNNLMFYSENSGNALSPGQRAELRLSLVLP